MAKKKRIKKSTNTQLNMEKALPQNIMPIGERVEENKNIYISQPVYKQIHKFTENKTTNESGGMLIGNVVEEFGKTNIIINGFIEAKYCDATPTTLKFTHETWDHVHKEIDKKFPGQKIVGWIHTHPNFGIFLSEYDKFIQDNFFKEDYQIAYVVDPIQNIEGFYFWINGKIERCKGFYKFDKMGAKLETETDHNQDDAEKSKPFLNLKNIVIGVLALCTAFLFFSNMNQNKQIAKLQKQQEALVDSANQSLTYMQQQIFSLTSRLQELENQYETKNEDITEEKSDEGSSKTENEAANTEPSDNQVIDTTGENKTNQEDKLNTGGKENE